MEIILGLALIFCGSGTIAYCWRSSDRTRERIAVAQQRAMLEMSDNHRRVRLCELHIEAARDGLLLTDKGEK